MLKKNLVLGSVASLALAVAAAPAFAQSPPQYPDFSLPWEQAQTQSLNAQQASEPGIITTTGVTASASDVTTGTSGVVASNDSSSDVVAYNQALQQHATDQSQYASEQSSYDSQVSDYNSKKSAYDSKESAYQQSWSDYQQKLNNYNARMQAWRSERVAPVAGETVVTATAPVVTAEVTEQPVTSGQLMAQPIIRERIIHRPVVAEETVTRPVVHEETVTRPVVREQTVMRPKTVWVPETRQVVENETVTRPVVTQETVTRPVVRDRVVRQEIIDRPIVREQVLAENVITTPSTGAEWVSVYPHRERLVVFETVSNPDNSMRGAPVMDSAGNLVGNFRHMTLQDGGIPEAVITLNDMKTVAVPDQHLRYDPAANVVVADLTYNQMEGMPARF